ncbi:hypothetical protein COU61_00110 [Candidatus Pacearchaeota archaeon CG10_big_fil_rev_8_21_14_0_10_35_13]|nr:MAG: hypothetical protein COU61_00110 [Candidatus Pacearchaeota archaeon CG10_big_fil_rev_8_21_14_0_10_35_13]
MHLKRNSTPKSWPVARKGTKYIVKPLGGIKNAVPLLIVLREMNNFGSNRREVKKILEKGLVRINDKKVKEEKASITLNDTVSVEGAGTFRVTYTEKGKYSLEEIKKTEIGEKISKVINKRKVKKGLIQVSFVDGRNLITKEKINVGDSALIDTREKKIKKVIEIKKGVGIIVISGKHLGKKGIVKEMIEGIALVEFKNKEIKLKTEDIMAI